MSGLRRDLLSNYLYSPISLTILLFQEFARWPVADVMKFSLTHTERQWKTHTLSGSLPVFMLFSFFWPLSHFTTRPWSRSLGGSTLDFAYFLHSFFLFYFYFSLFIFIFPHFIFITFFFSFHYLDVLAYHPPVLHFSLALFPVHLLLPHSRIKFRIDLSSFIGWFIYSSSRSTLDLYAFHLFFFHV